MRTTSFAFIFYIIVIGAVGFYRSAHGGALRIALYCNRLPACFNAAGYMSAD
jgi:hypothetical protein